MPRISQLSRRNFLIAVHDLLATTAALFSAFYLRVEGGSDFYQSLPLLFYILPYVLILTAVVCFTF